MKKIVLMMLVMATATQLYAQKYIARTGKVTFFSSTPVENIEAFNNEAASVIDAGNGDFAFQLLIKSFKFEKALMQEHFNENYMESSKYPKSTYTGKITNLSAVNFSKDGTYDVETSGKLTMHGVTQDVIIPATITVKGDVVTANAKFMVSPDDYQIKIPGVVKDKIAKEIEVTVNSIHKKK